MKEFIDKLISELKAGRNKECANNVPYIRLCDAISIVNELAEEYINTSTDISTNKSTEQPTWQQQTMNRFERVE